MVLRPPQIVYAEMLGAMGLLPLPEEVSRKIGDMIQAADESGVEELPSKATIVLEPRHNDYFWGIYMVSGSILRPIRMQCSIMIRLNWTRRLGHYQICRSMMEFPSYDGDHPRASN